MDIRAYLAIEIGLTRRLVSAWKKIAQPVYTQIAAAVIDHDWHKATMLVHQLDLTSVGEDNKDYIRYMLSSAAVYGGRRANKKGTTVLDHPDAGKVLDQTVSNMLQYFTNKATTDVQTTALQLIARAENAFKHQQIMGKSLKGDTLGHEFHGNQWTMYRGVGVGSDTNKDITWVTPDKALAEGYAKAREGGSVQEHQVTMTRTFDAGHDKRELTPKAFTASVMAQADVNALDKKAALAAREVFIKAMGTTSAPMLDLWAHASGRAETATFLKAMGFDSIKLEEDGKPTYGILKASKGDVDGHEFHGNQWTGGPGSANFKAWFGKSKIVNTDGSPLVVYHGTRTSFDTFDSSKGKITDSGYMGTGLYFTPSPMVADGYTRDETGGNIMPVYLSMKKPYYYSGSESQDLFAKLGGVKGSASYMTPEQGKAWSDKVRAGLEALGYDGIMDTDKGSGATYANEIVVFNSTQVKSAIGNSGAYDKKNPNITKGDVDGHAFHGNQWTAADGNLPAEPGTLPIKDGYVRLYHQSTEANVHSIAKTGITIGHAKGIEGPTAIYAGETPFYGPIETTPTVEFQVPKDQWDAPFVLRDVAPSDILAVHLPWHVQARYLEDNPDSKQEALDGKLDDINPEYDKAVSYIKQKYAKKSEFASILKFHGGGFNEDLHPRAPAGSPNGGEFTAGNTDSNPQQRWVINVPKVTIAAPRVQSAPSESVSTGPSADRPVATGPLPHYGKPIPGAVSVTATHYSQAPRTSVSGIYYGRGLKGAEAERLTNANTDKRLRSRIYFYVDEGKGIVPESGVGGYAHQVVLDNLYDPAKDPTVWRQGHGDTNASEKAVIDAGYDGYYVRDFANHAGVAVLLGDHTVKLQSVARKDDIAVADLDQGGKLQAQLGFRKKRKKGDAEPLYVSRKLINADEFIAWAKEQGFTKVLDPEELHVTIVYSSEAVDWDALEPDTTPLKVSVDGEVVPLGDKGAVVYKFKSEALQKRWKQWREAGASWDYESYQPHVSITYKNALDDLSKVVPFKGTLEFGPEEYETINEDYAEEVVEKADASGRYVTPLVDFSDAGSSLVQMVSSLNTNRLSTWGFTAEADTVGATRYQLTAVMDNRTSAFCRFIDGKTFDVQTAKDLVNAALSVQDPQDLAQVQPWPDQSKAAIEEYEGYSEQDLVDAGLNIPPYHPNCRTLCTFLDANGDEVDAPDAGSIPTDGSGDTVDPTTGESMPSMGMADAGGAVAADFDGLTAAGLTQDQIAMWNDYIDALPDEVLSALYDDAEADGVDIANNGDIYLWAQGHLDDGSWTAETAIDPFSGKVYLTEAEYTDAEPEMAAEYLAGLMDNTMANVAELNVDTMVIAVGDDAATYAQIGFLPMPDDWQNIRMDAIDSMTSGDLVPFYNALDPDVQTAVMDLLNSEDEHALQALVDMGVDVDGQSLTDAILAGTTTQFYLDLNDEEAVARAQEYLQP